MTKEQSRNIITKIHFYLLGFILLNFVLKDTLEISLNYRLAYCVVLLTYASGIVLFIWNFKPFKKIGFYYSLYLITPILTLIFWLFHGIFFAVLTSIFLYTIYPNPIKVENEKIIIYQKYQGLMGACCTYELTEKKYWLLEKKIKEINLNEIIDFNKTFLKSKNGNFELNVKYQKHKYEHEKSIETDTIIKIQTK